MFFVELVVGLSNNRKANACIMITLAIMRQNSLAAAELPRHDDLCKVALCFCGRLQGLND